MTKMILTAFVVLSLALIGCGGGSTEAQPTPEAETAQPAAAPPVEPAATEETPASDAATEPAGETAPAPASN